MSEKIYSMYNGKWQWLYKNTCNYCGNIFWAPQQNVQLHCSIKCAQVWEKRNKRRPM